MDWKLLGSGNEEVKIRDQFIKVMRKILKTRVGLDFVTIQNKIFKLNF